MSINKPSWCDKLNLRNKIRIIFLELIWNKNIKLENINRETVDSINNILFEVKNPWINSYIKERMSTYLTEKSRELSEAWVDIEMYINLKLTESPESFINFITTEVWIDFYNIDSVVSKSENYVEDIPVQAKQTKAAWIKDSLNATVWILKDENWNIVSNPQTIETIMGINLINKHNLNSILNYVQWTWTEVFRKTMELLIEEEEKYYWWWELKWKATKPVFIPWGWGGLTIARDFFIDKWDLVCAPNLRWPNIDWIITNKTKTPLAEIPLFWENWEILISSIEESLNTAINVWRKKITYYLNLPSNPTWVTLSEKDWIELNKILQQYEDKISIQIILDDPYWAFNLKDWIVRKPLSYHIDTNKNITIIEIWSHWTKEAWVYWLRAWILRIITSQDKLSHYSDFIWKAIRETFSMSPSLTQLILVKSILWSDIDAFSLEWEWKNYLNNLSKENIEKKLLSI